jgi:2-amino-4-hydroxy-6-hydroxymethyldihydropteridine diphosphokinase
MKSEILVLGLGSNVGDRDFYLREAIKSLEGIFGGSIARSPVYETEPWGVQHSNPYLNQVLVFATDAEPEKILKFTRDIERNLGREQKGDLSPRTLDVDILYLGHRIVESETLSIPHPSLQKRRFVLQPLEDVLPDFIHPLLFRSQKELNRHPDLEAQGLKKR